MFRNILTILLVLSMGAFSGTAYGEDDLKGSIEQVTKLIGEGKNLDAITAMDNAFSMLWQRTEFQIPTVIITDAPTDGFGMYQTRKDNVFPKNGAKVLIYLEPVGYKFVPEGKDSFKFGFSMDLFLLDSAGKVVFNKDGFLNQELVSHRKNREFFLNVTLNLTGMEKGDYTVKLITKDVVGKQQTESKVQIKVAD